MTKDLGEKLEVAQNAYGHLTDLEFQPLGLLANTSSYPNGLGEIRRKFVAAYVYAASRATRQASQTFVRRIVAQGNSEDGDLLDVLIKVEEAAHEYEVSVEGNGFRRGEIRRVMIREINAEISHKGYLAKIASPDRLTAKKAVEDFEDLARKYKDIDPTDRELRITRRIRHVLDHPPSTDD